MVPSCASAQRKLDKTTVLKMTVNYMKVNNGMFTSLLLSFFACCSLLSTFSGTFVGLMYRKRFIFSYNITVQYLFIFLHVVKK